MAYTVYMHSIRNAYQQNSTLVKWNLEESLSRDAWWCLYIGLGIEIVRKHGLGNEDSHLHFGPAGGYK